MRARSPAGWRPGNYASARTGSVPGTKGRSDAHSLVIAAAPCGHVVSLGYVVKTTTMLRLLEPIVPVVCSSGLAKSGCGLASSFVADNGPAYSPIPARASTQRCSSGTVAPQPDQPCLTPHGGENACGMPKDWSRPSSAHRVAA